MEGAPEVLGYIMAKSAAMRVHHGTVTYFNQMLKEICDEHPEKISLSENDKSGPPENVFGRLFAAATDLPSVGDLVDLASRMEEAEDDSELGDVPAGFAFLGQFIDHDLSFDATTKLGKAAGDLSKIENFRTPSFDLDSVYGSGPEVSPYLYGQEDDEAFMLLHGTTENPHDLQRNGVGRAIIGDARNDENLIISQIHGNEFIALHNKKLRNLRSGETATLEEFEEAREEVRNAYRRRVVDEFLPAVVHKSVLQPLMDGYYQGALPEDSIKWRSAPDMPVEFSAAAFRFGHTMIPSRVRIQEDKEVGLFELGGFKPVNKDGNVNLDLFFDWNEDLKPQMARKIDTRIASVLVRLPDDVVESAIPHEKNLAARNMIRAQITFKIPSGDDIANACFSGAIDPHPLVKGTRLEGKTPLWFYILAEAELHDGKLGPVGGNLVAGTILNLLLRH